MALAVLGSGEGDPFDSELAWFGLTGEVGGMPDVRELSGGEPQQTGPELAPRFAPVVDAAGRLADNLLELPKELF